MRLRSRGPSTAVPIDACIELKAEGTPSPSEAASEELDDPTMPTWGTPERSQAPTTYGNAARGNLSGSSEGEGSDLLPPVNEDSSDNASSRSASPTFGPSEYDYTPTEDDYLSGSDADVDTDSHMHSVFDHLQRISPVPSAKIASSPPPDDLEPGEAPQVNTPNDTQDEAPAPGTRGKCLPDALRAFQEWLLRQSSTGDLTIRAADSFLATLNMCLENDLLRCGTDSNPEHRLPLTLETLRRHTSLPTSDLIELYAVCPDFSCQTLKKVSTMDPNQPYTCQKCDKPITRRKVTRRRARKAIERHVPILRYSYCSIIRQLQEIISRPGIQEAIHKHREHLNRVDKPPGTLEDIQHGELWEKLMKGDARFFENIANLGLILMCDWFQPNSRRGAPSYSTGAISLCIANLPPHLRARPENKILVGVIPGPHEPDVHTINAFLGPMVDELKTLWEEGVTITGQDDIKTTVCAALIVCACDSPAARKLGGFPGTGAMYPCTACWCFHKELHVFDHPFETRSRREHKRAATAYNKLPNNAQREKFMRRKYTKETPGGYRPSALLRLPYWDSTTMVIVDPMHCLFLGIADWQFHTIWVDMKHLRAGEELDELQRMVKSTLRPRHCGRPPNGLGTSAAGSLTADPLRSLVTIDLPLAIPVLWDSVDVKSVAQRAHQEWARRKQLAEEKRLEARKGDKVTRAATKARQQSRVSSKGRTNPRKRARPSGPRSNHSQSSDDNGTDSDDLPTDAKVLINAAQPTEEDEAERGFLSWRKQDAEGILLFASAIKFLCARTIHEDGIVKGQDCLLKYLELATKLRGASRIHPNHHFATHIPNQLRRYGPMHQIWTYSGERLNYTLKNTNNNHHGGGEREQTFAAAFHQCRNSINRLSNIASDPTDVLSEWAKYMLRLDRVDMRGTAATEMFDQEGDSQHTQRRRKAIQLSADQFEALANALEQTRPELPFRRALWEQTEAPVLPRKVTPLREVTHNGRVFSMSTLGDSIVKARVYENGTYVERVGEIVDIWEHTYHHATNDPIENQFALIRWYKASPIFAPRSVWLWTEEFPHLDIEIYLEGKYLDHPALIPVSDICCHCARMSANLDGDPVWLTIGLERE